MVRENLRFLSCVIIILPQTTTSQGRHMIAQTFQKLSEKIVKNLQNKEIKSLIGRSRLKFTKKQILSYVFVIFEHSLQHRTFKKLHKEHQFSIEYSVFMKNISLFSNLFKYLFSQINEISSIKASSLYNCVDTTLIEEKSRSLSTKKIGIKVVSRPGKTKRQMKRPMFAVAKDWSS